MPELWYNNPGVLDRGEGEMKKPIKRGKPMNRDQQDTCIKTKEITMPEPLNYPCDICKCSIYGEDNLMSIVHKGFEIELSKDIEASSDHICRSCTDVLFLSNRSLAIC